MKVKFANKIFEVLYTKNVAGQTMYAVEDEPNHIDWLLNVEVVNAEKKELKKIEQTPTTIADDWVEDYWQHHKVKNPESYNGEEEIQFDHDGFIRFCQTHCQKSAWSEEDEKERKHLLGMLKGWLNTFRETILQHARLLYL